MGPIALAVCESQTLSYYADKVTCKPTWNKQALFASSSFLYQLPMTYYAGRFNVIASFHYRRNKKWYFRNWAHLYAREKGRLGQTN